MKWFLELAFSSVGRKQFMALTGFCFLGFLVLHLAGNLSLLAGPEALTAYAEKLHSLGPLIYLLELGLLFLAAVHVGCGLWLFLDNLKARAQRYAVPARAGGSTLSSRTMPYTGLLILFFLVIHLARFRFADLSAHNLGEVVAGYFQSPAAAGFYALMMVAVGLHVRHGFWSAFQTAGLNHPKFMPAVEKAAVVFAWLVAAGFGFLPLFVLATG